MASDRSRSRSRERILSTAVMVELHKLPQPERQAVQKLRTSISEISQLASLGGFTRILKDVAQQAMSLQLPDGSCSAFVIKAELQPVLERLIEVDDTLNTTMQVHLDAMETTFKSLVKSPDGTPYAMFSRAVEFSSRHNLFCYYFRPNDFSRLFSGNPLSLKRADFLTFLAWKMFLFHETFQQRSFVSSCLRSVHIACDGLPRRRDAENGQIFSFFSLFQRTPRVQFI